MTRQRIRPTTVAVAAGSAALLVLGGCTDAGPGSSPSATNVGNHAAGATSLPLATVGTLSPEQYSAVAIPEAQISAAVGKVDSLVTDVMARSKVPGVAVAVVHGGKVVFSKGYGVRAVGKPETVDVNTVFQLASVSKSVGATVIAKAVSDGTVKWTDPVVKYLPDFRLSDPEITKLVTIGDLYAHRSGIPGAAGDDLESVGFDRAQIIEKLRYFPLNPFRASYAYTNYGMTVGAQAVAAAARTTWEELSQKLLYQPLGMVSTSSRYDDFVARPDRASLHFQDAQGEWKPLYTRQPDALSPAGGVSSTVMDMASWMLLNLGSGTIEGRQVIKPEALLPAHLPQNNSDPGGTPDARSRFYGYGFVVSTTSTGDVKWDHSGAFSVGGATNYSMLPNADVGIIVLTNAAPVGAAEAVSTSFMDLVRTGTVERDWLGYFGPQFAALFVDGSTLAGKPAPATPSAARPSSDYVGTYRNDVFGDVVVTASGDRLTVQVGPQARKAPLTHYDGDVFSWRPPGIDSDQVSAVTFGGSPGRAQTIQLEFIDGYHFGTFPRVG